MVKKPVFNYKAYLKILGAVTIGIGIFGIISALLIVITKMDVDKLGITDLEKIRKDASDDVIRGIACGTACIIAAITMFEGWLMRRAAKDPKKSTFLLVILVISVISGVLSIISGPQGGISNILSVAISLILNSLALMSVINLRKEVNE